MKSSLLHFLAASLMVSSIAVAAPHGKPKRVEVEGFGLGFLGLATTESRVNEPKIKARIKKELAELADDLELDGGLRMRLLDLEPTRVVVAKKDYKEDVVRNTILLVEGDVETRLIQNSVVIALGKVTATDIRGSVVAAQKDIASYHIGGRDQETLVMTREQLHLNAAYDAAVLAEEGVKVDSPTHLLAINSKVKTPHPTRVRYQYVSAKPLRGMTGLVTKY